MDFFDITNFEFDFRSFGFSRIFVIGRDILYNEKSKEKPSIFSSAEKKEIVKNLKFHDFFHFSAYEANVELITKVKNREKFFLISVGDILNSVGIQRMNKIARISKFIKFLLSYDAKFILSTLANDIYTVRSPREIERIGELLGLTRQQARFSISIENIGDIIEKYFKG